ncbi:hypothetical protein GF406_13630 [candidate division KSB1 bacterium]|nr:hypothetical protein [candidate division KSB1 bacterium]
MNKKDKIDQEVRKTLDLFEHNKDLPANPYFYTRIRQRIFDQKSKPSFLTVLKPALFTLLVMANIGTLYWALDARQAGQADPQVQLIDVLATDLNIEQENNTLLFD